MRQLGAIWQALMLITGTGACLYVIASTIVGTLL